MAGEVSIKRRLRLCVGTVALLAILFSAVVVVVREGQAALVTRLGRPVRADVAAGLHFKLPWPIDQVTWLDMRRQVYEGGHTEMLTRDKKNVVVRVFVVWRVKDVVKFVQAVGAQSDVEEKLDGLLTNAAIATLGGYPLSAIVSTNPEDLKVDQIEDELLGETASLAAESYGVEIEQIRLQRVALPEENVQAVFEQMRAERQQHAARFKAEGEREASQIRAEAQLQAARIVAEGIEEAARIRGESSAEVARIYSQAHRADPEFYRFTRSLESLEKMVTQNTNLILRTDVEPFSLLVEKPKR